MKVQIQYDQAEDLVKRFSDSAQRIEDISQRLRGQVEILQDGAWTGRGADAFFDEMQDLTIPAMRKLTEALDATSDGFRRAIEMFREAEQNGGNLFKAGGPELRGPNYLGFLGKIFAGIKMAFPTQIAALTTKVMDRVKGIFPKLFGSGGSGSGMFGKLFKKVPFIPIGMGIYEHFSLPAEQRTWQGLVGQVSSGIAQTLVNLTPVGWVDIGTQVIGGAVQIGGEVFGAVTGVDTSEFVDLTRDITDSVSFDNIFDKAFTTVAENPSLLLGQTFSSAVDGVQDFMALPEGERTARNFAVQTISSLLQPNEALGIAGAEYFAEYQAKFNNEDPQAAIENMRHDSQNFLNVQDQAVDNVVGAGVDRVTDFFSGAMQRFGF